MKIRLILARIGIFNVACALVGVQLVAFMPKAYADDIPTATISGIAQLDSGPQGVVNVCFYGANSTFCTTAGIDGTYSINIPTEYSWGQGPVNYNVDLSGDVGNLNFKSNALAFTIGPDTVAASLNLTLQTQQVKVTVVDPLNRPVQGARVTVYSNTGFAAVDDNYQQLDYTASDLTLTPNRYTSWQHYTNTAYTDAQGVAVVTALTHFPVLASTSVASGSAQAVGSYYPVNGTPPSQDIIMVLTYPSIIPSPWAYNTSGSPSFTWGAIPGAARYEVRRASQTDLGTNGIGFDFTHSQLMQDSSATSFTDAANLPENDYLYYILAFDDAGNIIGATGPQSPANVIVDRTAPVLGQPTWSSNPAAAGSSPTITVPVNDPNPAPNIAASGTAAAEYFIGDTDPGQGNGTPMDLAVDSSDQLTVTKALDPALTAGVYKVTVRARDNANNWSPVTSTLVVIYDNTTTLSFTGKNKKDIVPSLAAGDHMPGLISSSQIDAADYGLTVQYKNGALDTHNAFVFDYATGTNCGKSNANNCHTFTLTANSFDWLVFSDANSSQGKAQGIANVTVDGVTTTNPFVVVGIDGSRITPATSNYLQLRVYAPGADPHTATPIYQASGSMSSNNSVKIH